MPDENACASLESRPTRKANPGRVCETTNSRFVEAKQEERWFAVRPLWSNPADRIGSIATTRSVVALQ